MRKPDENLEGQSPDHASEVDSKRAASLTGATEIGMLKPLGHSNVPLRFLLGYHSSWYGRFLAAGVGALAMMAAVLVSAIVMGINDPLPGLDVAINESTDIEQTRPIGFDMFSPSVPPAAATTLEPVRSYDRSKSARPAIRVADRPQRVSRSSSRLRIRKFVPTTLVIYAENGVIKRRIEPWL
jgi:hypothetical protein